MIGEDYIAVYGRYKPYNFPQQGPQASPCEVKHKGLSRARAQCYVAQHNSLEADSTLGF